MSSANRLPNFGMDAYLIPRYSYLYIISIIEGTPIPTTKKKSID